MIKIYHNPRCSKSRAGLNYLTENSIEFELIDYLKEGISANTLKNITEKMNIPITDIVRKHEDYFKKELKGKEFSEDQWFTIISENPKLLHRPIMEIGNKAILAQPPEKVREIM